MSLLHLFDTVDLPPTVTHLMEQRRVGSNYIYAISENLFTQQHLMTAYGLSKDGTLRSDTKEMLISAETFDEYKRGMYSCSVVEYMPQLEND